ncbi:MAG: 1-acyl-sn-glycerol-3-phosphate acyltransferase [Pseudomonadota bacterium]
MAEPRGEHEEGDAAVQDPPRRRKRDTVRHVSERVTSMLRHRATRVLKRERMADGLDPSLPPPDPRSGRERARRVLRKLKERVALKFPELTYANPDDPWLKRMIIRLVEHIAGRNFFVEPYQEWIREHIARGKRIIEPMLPLIDIKTEMTGAWPPPDLDPDQPLVIVANHPFGVLDGISALKLAEDLGRPFKVLIHKDLMKIPEIREMCLPIDFTPTREAQANNIRVRNEALALLQDGVTIVVFPAGGVATSPTMFGRAVDLPWKTFTARMILAARAQVVPIYFKGQCSRLFMIVSQFGQTLRSALLIRELRIFVGKTAKGEIGPIIPFAEIKENAGNDRKKLIDFLFARVHAMASRSLDEIKADQGRLPVWLKD